MARARTGANGSAPAKPTSKTQWAHLATHLIQLHSNAWVRVRIPDLSLLLAADAIPTGLREAATRELIQEQMGSAALALGQSQALESLLREEIEKLSSDTLRDSVQLHEWLVTQMVVEPELTDADLALGSTTRPPNEDMALLVQIARRERDTDARGVRLGVARLSAFDRFRDHHECSEDCAACDALVQEFSTAGVG